VNQAKLATKLKICNGCKQIPFEIKLTNFGNARTQYTFKLTNKPTGPWNAVLPEVLVVDSPSSGPGNSSADAVVIVYPGHGEGAYTLVITPSATADPSKVGNPLTMTFLARDDGVLSRISPAPDVLPLVLALAGLAVVARRSR
jgi:hypothetical protein